VKKKAKMIHRREYRLVGNFSCGFDMNVMARSVTEAERITKLVIGDLKLPKVCHVKIGKRYRLLVDCVDYFLDCNGMPEMDNLTIDLADDYEKQLA